MHELVLVAHDFEPPVGEPASTDTLEDLLEDIMAPYRKGLYVDPWKKYLSERSSLFFDRLWEFLDEELPGVNLASRPQLIADTLNRRYEDDEMFLVDEHGVYELAQYNPLGQWDYWNVGARWDGFLPAVTQLNDPNRAIPGGADGYGGYTSLRRCDLNLDAVTNSIDPWRPAAYIDACGRWHTADTLTLPSYTTRVDRAAAKAADDRFVSWVSDLDPDLQLTVVDIHH